MEGSLTVFIDAGYLFKQGAQALFGKALSRHEVVLAEAEFVERLHQFVRENYPNDEFLRTYWYDGTKGGVLTPEQQAVASLERVKFRKGRINSQGQQKGVDTLIVRDLMVLSQERSIKRAVVLSGDEDLREGIEYAQDRGVQVAVLGISAKGRTSQSPELVREADEVLLLSIEILRDTLKLATASFGISASSEESGAPSALVAVEQRGDDLLAVSEPSMKYARDWLERATPSDVASLVGARPGLPSTLDTGLMRSVVRRISRYPLSEAERRASRVAFWSVIDSQSASDPIS
jgi:uncharacterized LabA/DUF88 family protein